MDDTAIKTHIYQTIVATTRAPTASQVSEALGVALADVRAGFERLAGLRLLVLEPHEPDRIRMAPPFSGVETPFQVVVDGQSYFANCVWDALGVPAALHRDAAAHTTCGYSGQPMTLRVQAGQPGPMPCAIHFAIPAARWWDDIIET